MKINENILVGNTGKKVGDVMQNIYTNESVKCGYKVNGKDVYVKLIDLGYLPNAGSKNVLHGLTNFTPIKIEGIAYSDTLSNVISLPFATPYFAGKNNLSVQCSLTASSIYILTYNNDSNLRGYLNIYYTINS